MVVVTGMFPSCNPANGVYSADLLGSDAEGTAWWGGVAIVKPLSCQPPGQRATLNLGLALTRCTPATRQRSSLALLVHTVQQMPEDAKGGVQNALLPQQGANRTEKAAQRETFGARYPADVRADIRADILLKNLHPVAQSAGK